MTSARLGSDRSDTTVTPIEADGGDRSKRRLRNRNDVLARRREASMNLRKRKKPGGVDQRALRRLGLWLLESTRSTMGKSSGQNSEDGSSEVGEVLLLLLVVADF
jgi:hypothetical protein